MFGIGVPELIVILVIILIIFGAASYRNRWELLERVLKTLRKLPANRWTDAIPDSKKIDEKK